MTIDKYIVFLFLTLSCGSDSNSSGSVLFAKKTSSTFTLINTTANFKITEENYSNASNDFVTKLNAEETKLDVTICPTISDENFSDTCVWETREAAEESCQNITGCIGFYKDTRRNILNDQTQANDAYYFIGMGQKNVKTIYYNSFATRFGLTESTNKLQLSSSDFQEFSNDYPVLLNSCGNIPVDTCPLYNDVEQGTCVWDSVDIAKTKCNTINTSTDELTCGLKCAGFYEDGGSPTKYVGMADPIVLETFIHPDVEF